MYKQKQQTSVNVNENKDETNTSMVFSSHDSSFWNNKEKKINVLFFSFYYFIIDAKSIHDEQIKSKADSH